MNAQTTARSNTNQMSGTKLKYLVRLSLFMAIIVVMAFTPLGYIKTFGLSITFLMIPVAVAAMLLGPAAGAVCGLTFGITSAVNAFTSSLGVALIAVNLPGMMITSIVPRLLEGWLCGLIFQALRPKFKTLSYFIGAFSCAALNTLLFMTSLLLFFYNAEYIRNIADKLGATNPFTLVVGFVGLQGVVEAIVCTLLGAAIAKGVSAAIKNR